MERLREIVKIVDDAQGAFYRKHRERSIFLKNEIKNNNITVYLISENKKIKDNFKYKLKRSNQC